VLICPTVCPGSPPSLDHSSFSCGDSSLPGTTCNASCASGYRGSVSATCGDDGTWQAVSGVCTQICTCLGAHACHQHACHSTATVCGSADPQPAEPSQMCLCIAALRASVTSWVAACSSSAPWCFLNSDCNTLVLPKTTAASQHLVPS